MLEQNEINDKLEKNEKIKTILYLAKVLDERKAHG
jgi:hypothetical protein